MTTAGYSEAFVVAGEFNVSPPAPTSGQKVPFQVDAAGNLLINVAAGSSSGVQYTDGTTQATPTGTVALGKNPTNILHALGLSAAGNLNVNLAEGTISGGNAAASATGGAVPVNADYQGVNIGGNLVGVTGLALGATTKAPTVAIVDGSGNQITSFGGGTQFADSAASGATPTGTLDMGWDSANSKIRALKVDASQNLNVNVQASAALSVTFPSAQHVIVDSGSITANIGTTGGLALDATVSAVNPRRIQDGVGATLATVTAGNALKVDGSAVTQPVSGTFFQATQPVSIAAAVDVSDRSARLLGHVTVDNATLAVTQSGLWNVNQAIGVAGFEHITDGTNTAAVTAASALKVDGSAVTQPVSGTFFQATQPVSIAAAVDVSDRAARLLGHVTVDNASIAVTGTFFQATQPVSIAAAVDVSDRAARLLGHVTVDNATLAVTQSTSPWVENVSQFGGNPVVTGTGVSGAGIPRVTISSDSFPATQAISAATLPLSTNAAQETGGNLATLVTQTRNDAQMLDVMASILSQMKMLNMNLATCIPGSQVDGDTILLDTFPIN